MRHPRGRAARAHASGLRSGSLYAYDLQILSAPQRAGCDHCTQDAEKQSHDQDSPIPGERDAGLLEVTLWRKAHRSYLPCNQVLSASRDGQGAKAANVKRIRIHDLRHSAISLLIDLGFSATAIADRVGHESIDITYHYAHLFPTKQSEMADRLDMERMQKGDKYVMQGE